MRYGDIVAIGVFDVRHAPNQPGKIVAQTPLGSPSSLIAIGAGTAAVLAPAGVVATRVIAIGDGALAVAQAAAVDNVAVGTGAGALITLATGHVLIGTGAGAALTGLAGFGGYDNVFIGRNAGSGATQQAEAVQIGLDAGALAGQLYSGDVLIGARAGNHADTFNSVVIGWEAAMTLGAVDCVVIGESAAGSVTGHPNRSVLIGIQAGYSAGQINNSVIVGYRAADSGAAGTPNNVVVIGAHAARNITSAGRSTIVGDSAAASLVNASENTVIGALAAGSMTGSRNTLLGHRSAPQLVGSTYNIIIGDVEQVSALPSGPVNAGGGGLGFNIVIGAYDSAQSQTLAETPASAFEYIVIAGGQSVVVVDPDLTSVSIGSSKPGNWRTASGTDNIAIGHDAGAIIAAGSRSLFVGRGAGVLATGSDDSVLLGNLVAAALTTADNETIIGSGAAPSMTGASNLAVGRGAAAALTTGTFNTILGTRNTAGGAPSGPTSTSFNVVIGAYDTVSAADRNLAETPAGGSNHYVVIAGGSSIVVVDPGLGNVHLGSTKPGNWRTSTGTSNVALGGSSLLGLTSGGSNTAVGRFSMTRLTTGSDNIAIGRSSLASAAGSEAVVRNVAVGNFTLDALTAAAADNIVIGYDAAGALTNLQTSIILGASALDAATSSTTARAVVIGYNAVGNAATAAPIDSVIIGYQAELAHTTAAGTTSIGSGAGAAHTAGDYNTLLGFGVAPTLTTGTYNVIIGAFVAGTATAADLPNGGVGGRIVIAAHTAGEAAGDQIVVVDPSNIFIGGDRPGNWLTSSGSENTILGHGASNSLTSGSHNTVLGSFCGTSLTTGSGNIMIGNDSHVADTPAVGTADMLNIGASIFGDLANGDVRIGGSGVVSSGVRLGVTDSHDDTTPLFYLETTGANGTIIRSFTGTRNPNGTITGDPGDIYYRKSGTASAPFVNVGAAAGNTSWAPLSPSGFTTQAPIPGISDDSSLGYTIGWRIFSTAANAWYTAVDVTAGAAYWRRDSEQWATRSINFYGPTTGAAIGTFGGATSTDGTISTPAIATTTLHTSMRRTKASFSGAFGGAAGIRSNLGGWLWLGDAAGKGGFFVHHVWAADTTEGSQRILVGVIAANPAPLWDPDTLTDFFAIGNDTADTNLFAFCNDSAGTASRTDLGANFPCRNTTAVYEQFLYCPPNATTIYWLVNRLDTGHQASGSFNSNLPTNTTFMFPLSYICTPTANQAVDIDLMKFYAEAFGPRY